ncbi:hypothetical protein BDZ45DRAFT_441518 [Acephala macrosclerotiorum]|nr:hypothetical protein BDZ45DRAFT_441518 [Acephala macrosclerotiorum]
MSLGYDDIMSLFDDNILKNVLKEEFVYSLFAGIGDALHLLSTTIGIAEYDSRPAYQKKRYHFAAVDVNKCAIARDLIMLMLLDELAVQDPKSDDGLDPLNTIFYAYMGMTMPLCAFKHLYLTIYRALTTLKSGSQPLKWVHLYDLDILQYVKTLSQ